MRLGTANVIAVETVLKDAATHVHHDLGGAAAAPVTAIVAALATETEQIEIAVKYAGYIDRQQDDISQLKRFEQAALPVEFDYDAVSGLSNEIKIKLKNVRPATLAQAGRISGVTPAAVQLLMMTLKKQNLRRAG